MNDILWKFGDVFMSKNKYSILWDAFSILLMLFLMTFELWLSWLILIAKETCDWQNIIPLVIFVISIPAPIAALWFLIKDNEISRFIPRLYKKYIFHYQQWLLFWIWWNLMLSIVWTGGQFHNALVKALQDPATARYCLIMGICGVLFVFVVIMGFSKITKVFRHRWKLFFYVSLKNEFPLCSERGFSYPEIRECLEPWLPEVHCHAQYLFRQSLQILISTPKKRLAESRDFCLWVWLPFLEPSLVPLALEVLRENVPEDKVCALLHPWIENGILLVVDRLNLGKSKDYPPPGWNFTLWGWILDAENLDNGDISGSNVHEKEDFLRVQALLKRCAINENEETENS